MANTEGLPDEFVASLARASGGGGADDDERATAPVAASRQRQRQRRLEARMGLPVGTTPAAKVIRASPQAGSDDRQGGGSQPQPSSSTTTTTTTTTTNGATAPFPTEDVVVTTPLVGDVVERQPLIFHASSAASSHPRCSATVNSKASRFRKQKQQQQQTQVHPATGFPSLDVPLGTFVRPPPPKPRRTQQSRRNDERGSTTDDGLPALDPLPSSSLTRTTDAPNSGGDDDNDDSSLLRASRRDAQAMLSNMSVGEIQQAQRELQEAVSPELLAFLKNRRRRNGGGGEAGPKETGEASAPGTSDRPSSRKSQEPSASSRTGREEELQEKERIANLLSSVQTYEDIDAAFRAEMQQAHPLEKPTTTATTKGATDEDDETTTFQMACDMLRSTSPRQALWAARTVSLTLEEKNAKPYSRAFARPKLPVILSVSLRCLLDKSVASTYLLHTYALQSLYYLAIVYAHPSHVVFVSSDAPKTPACIYQRDFLDDAVPTPPLDVAYPALSVQPIAVEEESNENGSKRSSQQQQPAGYYSAASSTTSAIKDGQDFQRDPLWTLLSKMKIIPRLAFMLEHHHVVMLVESWVAICGILSMIAQRSPGAASVIVQHETFLPCLVKRALEQIHGDDKVDVEGRIPYAVMTLFCTLARQSRVAAEGLPLEEILPPVLTRSINTVNDFATQQLSLIVWRTLLRYGLGLEALASMLTMSARHLTLPYSNKFSLSTEFISAYAQFLECVKVFRSKLRDDADGEKISPASSTILTSAIKYLASTIKTVVPQSSTPSDHMLNDEDDNEEMNLILRFRYNTARLKYLSCWFQLFEQETTTADDVTSLDDHFSADDIASLLSALEAWVAKGGDVERSWNMLCSHCVRPLVETVWSLEVEAASGGFLCGFMQLVASLSSSLNGSPPDVRERFRNLQNAIIRQVFGGLKQSLQTSNPEGGSSQDEENLTRIGWINQCHFVVAKFLFHAMSTNLVTSSEELTLVRNLVFSLLARLSRGDESIAAVLFSSDVLFQTVGNPVDAEGTAQGPSPISFLFLGELCGSDRSRKQLDHSFKLCHGFGLTSAGWGPYALDSLLSALDQPAMATKTNATTEGPLLPLGRFWLWQTLSGSVRDGTLASGAKEATEVIAAVLQLLLEEEETEDITGIQGFCKRQATGSKLYHLMNVCLQAEEVLGNERIIDSADRVLDRYLEAFGTSENDFSDFAKECLSHSTPRNKTIDGSPDDDVDGDEVKGQQMLEKFVRNEGTSLTTLSVSPEALRALGAFVEDMAKAYREYGAQFDFCTKCMRAFLIPSFPAIIRCRMLQELDGMLHLLTLPKEEDDDHEISLLLAKSIAGGFSSVFDSVLDSADILNKVTSTLCRAESRSVGKFITAYCLALLARNLGSSLQANGLQYSAKVRLEKLDAGTIDIICRATALARSGGGTKSGLVDGVMKAMAEIPRRDDEETNVVNTQYVEQCIDQYLLLK